MNELKLLPEQTPCWEKPDWNKRNASLEFRKLIDMMPELVGMISSDKESVELGNSGLLYESNMKLYCFLPGALYARAIGKTVLIYYPKGFGSELEKKIEEVFGCAKHSITKHEYPLIYKRSGEIIEFPKK